MSLVNLALRLVTIHALRGATYADERVYDSQIDAIDERITKEKAPVIVVYIDDDSCRPIGMDLLDGERNVSLVIEVSVASRVEATEPGGAEQIVIPHTDPGLEAAINIMGRQITRALAAADTEWAQLWRSFVMRVNSINSIRGASAEKGVRWAARQIIIGCETMSEPEFGAPAAPGGPWARLISALAAIPDREPMSRLIAAEIATPPLPDWRRAAASLGVNRDTAAAIGIAPIDDAADGIAAAEIVIEPDDGAQGVTVSLDEATQ
ncbi:hypothetical protein BJ122_102261 [Rhodopseudomonas faecalis]|uniref:Uncharacterized protein n=1 Tax=Rhodopseudomonas faecalis TaxID=99655 RepID=A0A318TT64_9BRAD|nr:hypothetical protein [Rhodopseudomonas faecalis]PYF05035.1 hypothetical protein BJ122_102261 [Rhodopseudomonas faecalis]